MWELGKGKVVKDQKPFLNDKQAKSPTMHDIKEDIYPNELGRKNKKKKKTCQNLLFLLVEKLFDTVFL